MYVSAIVLAAGRGERFKSSIPKSLAVIKSKPALIYSLKTFQRLPCIKEIIVVVNALNKSGVAGKIRKFGIDKVSRLVLGGRRRQDSVANALKAVSVRADLILIHDAVRPFIAKDRVCAAIRAARLGGAAIVGVPVKPTIKSVKVSRCQGVKVEKTLERNKLWEIQTPQVFKRDLIIKAYKKFGKIDVTDDAMLVEKLGAQVKVILGSYENIKITTPEDLILAQAIARKWKTA